MPSHVGSPRRSPPSLALAVLVASVVALLTPAAPARLAAQAAVGVVTGHVTDAATGEPLAGATVRVAGTPIGAQSRTDGRYRIQVAPGARELRVTLIGYAMQTAQLMVLPGDSTTRDFALVRTGVNLEEVVIVGSRGGDRTVTEAPVPVDVLSSEDIRQTGLTEASQIIQRLAPSFNFPRPSVNDGTDYVRPATLRGLGPDQVLVLVNGKRRHNTALVHVNQSVGRGSTSVDLNAIPAAAIDRIEILRDGAAAQYGSDAIAGVINVILKSDARTTASSTVGQTTKGDGRVVQADGNFGRVFGDAGFFHLTGEYRDRERTNRARRDVTQTCIGDAVAAGCDPSFHPLSWQGDAETTDYGFFLNSALPLQRWSATQLYGFGGVTWRDGLGPGFYRRSQDDRTVRKIYPNGFLPLIRSDILDASAAAGVRGAALGWGWDLSTVIGANSFKFHVDSSVNTSLGLQSPTSFYAGDLIFDQWTSNLDVVRDYALGVLGTTTVAAGTEFRRDEYQIKKGDPYSYMVGTVPILDGPNAGRPAAPFAQVFPGFRPEDEKDKSRTNVAGYLDVEVNPLRALLVSGAGRVERYSDFGTQGTGKVAARVEPVPHFALRGAAQTGFRAPSLQQSYFSSVATNFVNVNGVSTPFEIRTFTVESKGGQLLGAKPLRPERSLNLSGGVAFNPLSNAALTVDYYDLIVKDRIVFSGNFLGDSVKALLERNNIPGVNGARYFTNAIDTRTRGVDVVLNSGLNFAARGLLRFTAGYNANWTRVLHVDPTPPEIQRLSTPALNVALFDRVQRALVEKGQPRNNVSLTLDYRLRNFGANAHTSRFGKHFVAQPQTSGALDQWFGAKWITDASVSYKFFQRLDLTVGGNNIFNVYPDTVITPNQTRGIYKYSGQSPFGINGAYYYARVGYDLSALPGPFRKKED